MSDDVDDEGEVLFTAPLMIAGGLFGIIGGLVQHGLGGAILFGFIFASIGGFIGVLIHFIILHAIIWGIALGIPTAIIFLIYVTWKN